MKRYSLQWYRYRMFSGLLFALLGIVIGIRLLLIAGPPQSKLLGFGLAAVTIALGAVRVLQYVRVRAAGNDGRT